MSAYCPTILESACEESRLMSYRNKNEQEIPRAVCLLEIADNTLESDCTSIDKVDQQSRSISLVDQLKKEFSNHKQYNLPRQIKSLFSMESLNEDIKLSKKTQRNMDQECEKLTKKQYDDIMAGKKLAKYDLPMKRDEDYVKMTNVTSHKTLKQSIYEKLIQAKREKDKFIVQVRKSKQNIKQATFRPKQKSKDSKNAIKQTTLNRIKDAIKQKIAVNIVEPQIIKKTPLKPYGQFYINIGQESDRLSPPQTKPNAHTKYENILKQNINCINNLLTSTNKRPKNQAEASDKAKHQSFLRSLKLRENLMKPTSNYQNTIGNLNNLLNMPVQNDTLNRHRSLTSLSFEQRQKKLISTRNEKIVKHSIEKQKDELKGCTFKPHLTPYRSNPTQQMQRWSSYAELNKKKIQNKY